MKCGIPGSGSRTISWGEVFVEFQQLANPQRDRRRGLGLQLAIVKRLARLLNHSVGVVSTPGVGSCFWVEVPLAERSSTCTPETEAVPQPLFDPLPGARVLVLDDEISVLESMRELLERWGCQVDGAVTVEEAESVAHARPPDLVIIHYRLSGILTGLDVAASLRNNEGGDPPVLIITGDTAPERLREARSSGYPLLHKPVQPAKLRSALRHLLLKTA